MRAEFERRPMGGSASCWAGTLWLVGSEEPLAGPIRAMAAQRPGRSGEMLGLFQEAGTCIPEASLNRELCAHSHFRPMADEQPHITAGALDKYRANKVSGWGHGSHTAPR